MLPQFICVRHSYNKSPLYFNPSNQKCFTIKNQNATSWIKSLTNLYPLMRTKNHTKLCLRQLKLILWTNSTPYYTRWLLNQFLFSHRRIILCGALDSWKMVDYHHLKNLFYELFSARKLMPPYIPILLIELESGTTSIFLLTITQTLLGSLLVLVPPLRKCMKLESTLTQTGYKIIKKFPKTPELNSISSAITHSGQEMTPELVLNHLRLHANKQSIAGSQSVTQQVYLFTNVNSIKFNPNSHNTQAPHPQCCCWMLYLHLRPNSSHSARA
ncbi:hypothetical protein VP01_1555g2 [Puccinia sorghi]|uniref:Uncharacterized protein n=1 Tax=Puccinia sorghi TaxID=27349 RepID=A0A0L6VJY3_9BASI|nr:hypothetical protein VP01_1555g2 [Puccinia sorghi]